MIRTAFTQRLGLDHPVVLGGMGGGHTAAALVAAVCEAGGLGILGLTGFPPAEVARRVAGIRAATGRPFGLNFLLFATDEPGYAAALAERPAVMSFAWARPEQDLHAYFDRAHAAGSAVMHMAGEVPEAIRAAEAGADFIVAQGSEGGGHVSWMGTLPLVPMVVDAVSPRPVLAAGGIADGRGLAAALALGADGALLGTRFLATDEAPLHPALKQAIVESDGHDTVLTEIPDRALPYGPWPGAMARARRNRLIERWAGREWDLRKHAGEVGRTMLEALRAGDVEESPLLIGQDAGLIDAVRPAGKIVRELSADAEEIIAGRLPRLAV